MTFYEHASHDENTVPTLIGVSSVDGVTPTPVAVDPITGRVLVDTTWPGGMGSWWEVEGVIDGVNTVFIIPVELSDSGNIMLFFERQPQMPSDDFVVTVVFGSGETVITYEEGHQPFNGATLHRAFVII